MNIDNYSKAIGIVYATSHMMHPMDESVDVVALRLYNEALSLLTSAEVPQVKKSLIVNPVEETPQETKAPKASAKKERKNAGGRPKMVIEAWHSGEDSWVRVAQTLAEAIKNKPEESTRTSQQIQNRWYYLRQLGKLLSKGQRVFYTGNNQNFVVSLEKIKGTISAFTDDKTSAVVYFDSGPSAYTIPVCDLTPAGDAK